MKKVFLKIWNWLLRKNKAIFVLNKTQNPMAIHQPRTNLYHEILNHLALYFGDGEYKDITKVYTKFDTSNDAHKRILEELVNKGYIDLKADSGELTYSQNLFPIFRDQEGNIHLSYFGGINAFMVRLTFDGNEYLKNNF